jgi:hypothetical protein
MARSVTDSVVNVKRSLGRRGVDACAGYCEIGQPSRQRQRGTRGGRWISFRRT